MAHVSMTHGYSIIVNHGLHVIRLRVTMWYDYIYIYIHGAWQQIHVA